LNSSFSISVSEIFLNRKIEFLALALASVVSLSVAGEKNLSKDKAAAVNGTVITQADLEREMDGARQRASRMDDIGGRA